MTRLPLLLVLTLPLACGADLGIDAVVAFKDPRVSDKRLLLRWTATGDDVKTVEVYLTRAELGREESWTLLYENEEAIRLALSMCRHNPQGLKVTVHGREVRTLTGRGMLVDSIKSSW